MFLVSKMFLNDTAKKIIQQSFGKSEYFEYYIENTTGIVLYGPSTYLIRLYSVFRLLVESKIFF